MAEGSFFDAYEFLYSKVLYPLYESGVRRRGTLRYLAEFERDQWRSEDELRVIQWERTSSLLAHCQKHVPYYRDRWKAEGIDCREIRSLEDFSQLPILTKDDIRASYERLVAEPYRGRTMRKATGGSTGQPLVFEYTRESFERRVAVMMRGYGWAGSMPGRRTMYIWGADIEPPPFLSRTKTGLHHLLLRREILNSFLLTNDNAEAYLDRIDAYRPHVLVGYVAPLHLLALRRKAGRARGWTPSSIITGAERLHDFQRVDMEQAFGCRVFNTYGCREFMLIASECAEHDGLHANIDHLVVELLDEAGRPAREGRVAITDLHNYGMPFIRYVNGDCASALDGACTCGRGLPRLRSVDGRVLDMIRTRDGRIIPGEFFPHLMKDVRGVDRFQVVQRALDEITIRVVRTPAFDDDSLRFLEREVGRVVGAETTVRYEFVSDIPLTRSGKLRVTVSELQAPEP